MVYNPAMVAPENIGRDSASHNDNFKRKPVKKIL